jgi:SAM-dependent methyltransferase
MASFASGPEILDIGYASAPNRHLCEKGHVVGYDISAGKKPFGYDEIVQGDITNIADLLAGRRFDTILLGEVIEHVEAPYTALKDLKTLMHDNSRLIISTPNPLSFPVLWFEFFWSKRFFYTTDHLYYFLPRWMERMLDITGYTLEKVQSVGLYNFPVPAPKRLSYLLIYIASNKASKNAR